MTNQPQVIPTNQPSSALDEEARIGEKIAVATPATLMWWKFRKHKMAVASGIFLILMYVLGGFCEFISPYLPDQTSARYKSAPPSDIHIRDAEGTFHTPFVYGLDMARDPETLRAIYTENTGAIYPIKLFTQGPTYKFWGLWETSIHLFGLDQQPDIDEKNQPRIMLMGADRVGRDVFTMTVYGARISLSIGLIGVFISLGVGIVIGGISGFYGGVIDNLIQRVIEFIRSIPQIPLWMALSAALPLEWPVLKVYFAISIILSLVGWTNMARVVRGRFLAMREEDFILSARLTGSSEARIILVHMVPSFLSHIIASLTLAVPYMILSETSLSFIGLGLRAPAISWGVLLAEAQNVRSIALTPWVFWPAVAVIATVLAFNFLGDGLRDAADPYAR
ncbi:MAG TPA: ABC transporter permease [Anaerolineales bacterium]|nr:ABC transporter permease [Anaerolineales bacterium]